MVYNFITYTTVYLLSFLYCFKSFLKALQHSTHKKVTKDSISEVFALDRLASVFSRRRGAGVARRRVAVVGWAAIVGLGMCAPAPAPASAPLLVAALVLATLLAFTTSPVDALAEGIIAGSREPCQNEGEEVAVDSIKDMSCFRCICKNGFVECQQEQCPDVKNCYMQMPREGCCVKCKGCLYKGVVHSSDTEWTEPGEPCRILRCEAGVVTESTMHCYTPCDKPKAAPAGQCCPSCHGCHINGQKVSEGRDATISEDPCLKCHCSKAKMTCVKYACPVLPCPSVLQVTLPGECCPRCGEGKPAKLLFPDHTPNKPCIFGKDYHFHGKAFTVDRCTQCSCINGTTICSRTSCPVLECAPEHQKTAPGECCPHCPPVEEVRSTCTERGKTYEDGESWRLDECRSCMCHSGEPRCAEEQCPPLTCPAGHRLERPPSHCCPRCVESDGVCTVFGDPHYKTFDGKFYSFQGACKYQLAADCANHTFSIRVTNDGRGTRYSSWTKTVSIKIGDVKINLGRKMRVKVDGVKVNLPHDVPGKVAHIEKKDDTVLVNTGIGIKLTWDGTGFLEVGAPTSYKNKLCGLCGNFNSVVRDDLKMRNGDILKEVNREDMSKFGGSWRVGGKKACTRIQEKVLKEKPCHKSAKRNAHRMCRFFNKSESFSACRHKLNPHNYYESCVMDMCECPTQTCYCEAFSAYARECKRLGAPTSDWRRETHCVAGGAGAQNILKPSLGRRLRHKASPAPEPQLTAPMEPFLRPQTGRARKPPPILH